ncbi:MAG: N-6 DNA methylase [Proteobacteria bacterium]|nr:N-6 DNA methylase [Pseudomonadota bacterium]
MNAIRATGAGTGETSYYGPLTQLLNVLGRKLKPKVFCLSQLQEQGAGHPDFALYTTNQLHKATPRKPVPDQPPERGVIEAKPLNQDVYQIAADKQVDKYWERYGLVLVTNFNKFLLVGRDQFGRRVNLEHFEIAESPDAFWELAAAPGRAPEALGMRFTEFLTRVLLHNAPLTQPKDVAWFLASYARDALARIEAQPEIEALDLLRTTLEEALGMKFEGAKGAHFFHSTLVQTLFYGIFSAWVLWCKENPEEEARKGFDAKGAAWHLRLPVLRALFEQINMPGKLGLLKLDEVVEWAALTLRRVDDKAFFARFREEHAVEYFYEPFLEAFDPALRKALGVWYTPPEVVDYMVERVDTVLRTELGVEDGLADDSVYVLDPCCGTGSYLVAVLRRIEKTLRAKGEDALIAADLKAAALERIAGFEILPAPFVVAHMQLSLLLEDFGAELGMRNYRASEEFERPAVYLTNALTGWQTPEEQRGYLAFPELHDEMERAGEVKRDKPILVILGNPPYNSFAGVGVAEERELTDAYRTTKQVRAPEGQGLNDLYVRFYRMAERRIAERTGRGVVSFISNYSWLDGLSFTGMRERYMEAFDRIWIDCLNGDKYKTGKLTPEGDADPSIFSTEKNREGIQVGTTIALLVRNDGGGGTDTVRFRHLWGKTKPAQLLATAKQDGESLYQQLRPSLGLGLPFLPAVVAESYLEWALLAELFPVSFPGVQTCRDQALVDIERERLESRMEKYFDSEITHEEMAGIAPVLMRDAAGFKAKQTREYLMKRGFLRDNIVRYCYRPFDVRWLYWEPETKLLDRNRADYVPHVFEGNRWIVAVQKARRETARAQVIRNVGSRHLMERGANVFPLCLGADGKHASLFQGADETKANLSDQAAACIARLSVNEGDLFDHTVAVLHSSPYLVENAGALRQDWPRIPLPAAREALLNSAELGRRIAALLDSENPVKGVTSGTIRPEMKAIGPIQREGGGQLAANRLRLTARWGYAGQNRVTMPGPGDARLREFTGDERKAIEAGAAALGLSGKVAMDCLGDKTFDIYLNEVAYWCNVPERVWRYTIGGYQVVKKWLSYREYELLGRPLTKEEAREVTNIVRRIAAILLLEPGLDANYRAVCEDTYAWRGTP